MPNITAAKKALRQSIKRRSLNDANRKRIKELTKQFLKALDSNAEEAQKLISQVVKALDKAAKKNVIHPNKAARHKSVLQRKLNSSVVSKK